MLREIYYCSGKCTRSRVRVPKQARSLQMASSFVHCFASSYWRCAYLTFCMFWGGSPAPGRSVCATNRCKAACEHPTLSGTFKMSLYLLQRRKMPIHGQSTALCTLWTTSLAGVPAVA